MGLRPSLDVLIGVAALQIASEFGPITDPRARRYNNFIRKHGDISEAPFYYKPVQETLSLDKGVLLHCLTDSYKRFLWQQLSLRAPVAIA